MTTIAATIAAVFARDAVPEPRPQTPTAVARVPVEPRAEDCECASAFGRLMMWATRNVPR